jgi:hypothetical protein
MAIHSSRERNTGRYTDHGGQGTGAEEREVLGNDANRRGGLTPGPPPAGHSGEPRRQVLLEAIDRDPVLIHRVPIAYRHRLILE